MIIMVGLLASCGPPAVIDYASDEPCLVESFNPVHINNMNEALMLTSDRLNIKFNRVNEVGCKEERKEFVERLRKNAIEKIEQEGESCGHCYLL